MAMSTSGGAGGSGCSLEAAVPAQQLSRYESQKRRDWQTFTRYLTAHRPPLELRRCSGAHVLEFLRYLDRFGKTRVHAPPCPAYGGRATAAACQCPLRQAWGSLDALVGRLRAAFDEPRGRLGGGDQDQMQPDSAGANPFAASAVRLYLSDIRDAQARARGISYHKKKKQRKGNKAAPSSSKNRAGSGGAASEANARAHGQETMTVTTAPVPHLPPPCPTGLPFECCDFGSVVGGAHAAGYYGGFYLPLLFNPFI